MVNKGNCVGIIVINEKDSPEYQGMEWSIEDSKVLFVRRLAVHPKCQKQGIARKLMDYAEKFAVENNYSSIRLDVYSGNPRAINFYEARGYKRTGQVYFPRRELPFFCYDIIFEERREG